MVEEPLLYISLPRLEHYPNVTYTWVIMAGLVIISLIVRRNLRLVPTKIQCLFEMVVETVLKFMDDVMGEGGRRYFPLIGTLAIFILISNLLGIVPGFMSPTSNINTNAAMAITVFLATHYVGFRAHGFKYVKHFTGPYLMLAPLMFPIELIGHFARPLSLTVRLFGNIRGEDMVLIILAFLVPYFVPMPMMFLAIFTSLIQTFIFILLSMNYLAGAMHEAH